MSFDEFPDDDQEDYIGPSTEIEGFNDEIEEDEFDDTAIQEEISDLIRSVRSDFVPETEDDFDWIMAKIRGYENEKKDREKTYRQKVRELDGKISFFKNRFALEMEGFAVEKLAASRNKKKKSFKLPCGGLIGYRSSSWKLKVTNSDAFGTWAELCGVEGVVSAYKPVINQKAVENYVKQYGEVPDGAMIELPKDEFYMR